MDFRHPPCFFRRGGVVFLSPLYLPVILGGQPVYEPLCCLITAKYDQIIVFI
jgi:hypothetical protein